LYAAGVTSEHAEPGPNGRSGGAGEPHHPATVDMSRILTIPNVISFIRLACIPIFLYLLFGRHNRAGARAVTTDQPPRKP